MLSASEKQPHILVVGEYQALNEFLTLALREIVHCQVACVSSSVRALHVAPAFAPDLLILDFHLRDLNGFQLYEQLHAKPALANVPTILLNTDLAFPLRDDPCLFCLQDAFDLDELLFLVACFLLISNHLHTLG